MNAVRMQAVAFLTLLGFTAALRTNLMEQQTEEKPKKGLFNGATDMAGKSEKVRAAQIAMAKMANQIDGTVQTTATDIANNMMSSVMGPNMLVTLPPSLAGPGIVSPTSSIVQNHDKVQIANLKQKGKIMEGFTSLAFVKIPGTGGDRVALASTPIFPYGFGLRTNLALNLMVDNSKQGSEYCYFDQLPPKQVTEMYSRKILEESYGRRTTFCAVRHPYERIVAAWQNHDSSKLKSNCKVPEQIGLAEKMNEFIQKELTAFEKGDYLRSACQLIPQSDYTEGFGGCSKLMDYEHLDTDFDALMKEHGYNLTMAKAKKDSKDNKCSKLITSANLTASSRQLIDRVYKKDFDQLGKQFGWIEESIFDKLGRWIMIPLNALTSTD